MLLAGGTAGIAFLYENGLLPGARRDAEVALERFISKIGETTTLLIVHVESPIEGSQKIVEATRRYLRQAPTSLTLYQERENSLLLADRLEHSSAGEFTTPIGTSSVTICGGWFPACVSVTARTALEQGVRQFYFPMDCVLWNTRETLLERYQEDPNSFEDSLCSILDTWGQDYTYVVEDGTLSVSFP